MLDFLERKKRIDALRELMQEELEKWASENEVLGKGETLYFTLQVVKRDSKQRPRVKHTKKFAPVMRSKFRKLTKADWEKILSADWFDHQKESLIKLRKSKNKSLPCKDIFGNRDLPGMGNSEPFNVRFRKAGLPYRICSDPAKGGEYIHNKYYYVCVMPNLA